MDDDSSVADRKNVAEQRVAALAEDLSNPALLRSVLAEVVRRGMHVREFLIASPWQLDAEGERLLRVDILRGHVLAEVSDLEEEEDDGCTLLMVKPGTDDEFEHGFATVALAQAHADKILVRDGWHLM